MILKKLAILAGTVSLVGISYFIYLKKCYRYLKSIGYDHPPVTFFIGNLAEFANKENSVSNSSTKPIISHYSKTLRRFTSKYGKIWGYYEGHSPVIVLADPDLVTELFVNQNKLTSYRRSFPMSKSSNDPTADVFISNGIKWLRIRYALEKVMFNLKNMAKCLEYTDESFLTAFIKQPDLNKPQKEFNIHNRARLFIVYSMINIIFGTDLQTFILDKPLNKSNENEEANKLLINSSNNNEIPNLKHAQLIANKFDEAFGVYESFSLLKFFALTIPELNLVWKNLENFKKFFNRNIYTLPYFADPMDWFQVKLINKHLMLYATAFKEDHNMDQNAEQKKSDLFSTSSYMNTENDSKSSSHSLTNRKFGYLNSFLSLTTNSIFKYPKNNLTRLKIHSSQKESNFYRNRALTTTSERFLNNSTNKIRSFSVEINPVNNNMNKKVRTFSNDFKNLNSPNKKPRMSYLSTRILNKETETNEFENWKLTIDEAISNSLITLFAGYETTSSAIGFCCHVLSQKPEEKVRLIEEIKENWKDLSFNLDKYEMNKNKNYDKNEKFSAFDSESSSSLNDDVFEEEENYNSNKIKKNSFDEWSDLNEAIEKLKYLDMFVKEVLRMFPIANSMVSRKCILDDFYLDNGKYYIPKDMNVVVDVLSIHYDKTFYGPVDTEIFYPERFLTERNPAAWLAFGIGARKCLGMKLAISQIKLFIVRLLQNYEIRNDLINKHIEKFADSIETKDVFFSGPIDKIQVSISKLTTN